MPIRATSVLASWASILCPENESYRTQVQVELMISLMQETPALKLKEIIGQQNERIIMEVVSNSGGSFWNWCPTICGIA